MEDSQNKSRGLVNIQCNFTKNKRGIKVIWQLLPNKRFYQILKLDKNTLIAIVSDGRVKVVMINLKRKSLCELKWFKDSTKLHLMSWSHKTLYPMLFHIQHDTLYLRNFQIHTIEERFRSNEVFSGFEYLTESKEGLVLLRKTGDGGEKIERINANYDYLY